MNDPESVSEDFFWQGLTIRQDNHTHKIGTDAILLASWVPTIIHSAHQILDAGTGTGIISLALAMSFPKASVLAVDIDEHAVRLAMSNIENAGMSNRVTAKKADVLRQWEDVNGFDLVVSNPPYYMTHQPSGDPRKKLAKHAAGPVAEWVKSVLQKMVPSGHGVIIVPANDAEKWIQAANAEGVYVVHRLDVYSFETDDAPVRSLLHFKHTLIRPELSRLVLYNAQRKYTPEYLSFSGLQMHH